MSHFLLSLLAIRAEDWAEVIERARHVKNYTIDDLALANHVDPYERRREPDFDPLELLADFEVVDLREVPDEDRPSRGRSKGFRAARQVDAVMLHQTATDALDPDHDRLLGLPAHCHIGERDDGTVVVTLLHKVTDYVYHGHAGNRFCIGVEVQCRAAGLVGNKRTFWRSKKDKTLGRTYDRLVREPSAGRLAAVRAVIRYYSALMELRGEPIKGVVTHRQTAAKRSDPGQAIARVGNDVVRELGLEDWSQRTWGKSKKGRPQPDQWTGFNHGTPYFTK